MFRLGIVCSNLSLTDGWNSVKNHNLCPEGGKCWDLSSSPTGHTMGTRRQMNVESAQQPGDEEEKMLTVQSSGFPMALPAPVLVQLRHSLTLALGTEGSVCSLRASLLLSPHQERFVHTVTVV